MRVREKNSPLRVVRNVEGDENPNLELIMPMTGISDIKDPINDIAIPMDVNSEELYVDHDYQRDRSHESLVRIQRMVREWNWALFERPLVYRDIKNRIAVIDGQHTSIAWRSHPKLPMMIPVNMLTGVHSAKIAAEIFVGRNMNRTRLHQLQEYKAALFADKEWAVNIASLAKATGVRIPSAPELARRPNTLMAVKALDTLIDRWGYTAMKRVLDVLTEGELKPIREQHLNAMATLLLEEQYKGQFTIERMKAVIRSANDNFVLGKAIQEAVETKMKRSDSLANIYRREYQTRFGVK